MTGTAEVVRNRSRGRHSAPVLPRGGRRSDGRKSDGGKSDGGKSGGRRPLVAALLVLCLAALVALGLHRRDVQMTDRARTQALAAARTVAPDILGYDYRSVESSIARARADTTGSFRTQYDTTAKTLLPQAKQLKAIVQATVGSAAVMSATKDRVQVLLFVDQATVKQVPGEKTPTTRIDQSRVRMTLTHVHGQWLVSELSAL